jgi:S-adenosylmethionine/arginine decarboxylase-like enzyme
MNTESNKITIPFGYSYYLDMYDCREGAADDLELHYRFLERVVDKIGMTRMSQPVVMHGPTKDGDEIYPDKAGVSGWVPLIESGIQIHSMEPKRFITLDVYSCNKFDSEIIYNYAKECFGFTDSEHNFFVRGRNYGNIK